MVTEVEDLKEEKVSNTAEINQIIQNGLSEALFGSFGVGPGTQLSQVDTLFKNNRWYLVSNMRQLLSEIYVEHGLIQTVVDVPVEDAFRGGVEIKTKQLDDDDITKLQNKMEREGDMAIAAQANKWNRLYGGAGIVIMTDQDPKSPLNMDIIKEESKVAFKAVDMWELFYDEQNTDDFSLSIDGSNFSPDAYNYYGIKLDGSRVLRLKGIEAPSFIRPRLRGWGVSIIEAIVRSVNQYLKATDLTFEVLDEFKVDIYKIKGLAQTLLIKGGTAKVHQRVELANREKNYQSAITMDAEDDYQQKQVSFSGLAEAQDGIRTQLASDLRMPMTKLFGISSAGFSSGEDDIENYNAMVESSIRTKTKFEIMKMVEIRCQQIFGMIPDDLEIEFKPLRVLSSEQEETVKTSKFNRVLQARSSGEISSSQFKEACNIGDLLPVKLEVDDQLYPTPMQSKDLTIPAGNNPKSKTVAPVAPTAKNEADIARIAVMGVTSGGYILTGKRRDNGLWVSPAGHMEGQETPLEAACRECEEESGITNLKQIARPLKSEKFYNISVDKHFEVHPFISELDSRVMPKTINDPDSEVSVWRWVPISKNTDELKPENRHARKDLIIKHLLG